MAKPHWSRVDTAVAAIPSAAASPQQAPRWRLPAAIAKRPRPLPPPSANSAATPTPPPSTYSPSTQRMVDEVANHFGALDILVNCVGLNREEKAEDFSEDQFDFVLDVNLKGAMFQAQAAARHMIRRGLGGKQVHIGSVRTQLALRGRGYAAYCASKGGLGILCKQLAAEWAPD